MFSYILKYPKTLFVMILTFGILCFVAYSFVSPHGMFAGLSKDLKKLEPTEGFSYTDLDGNKVNLKTFKGKPLIINSWATWMPFSQTELPLLNKVKSEYGDAVHIVAINRMEDVPIIRYFITTFGISNAIVFLVDPSDHFYKAIGGYAMPETVFYNAEGELVGHTRGVLKEDELRSYIDVLIKK